MTANNIHNDKVIETTLLRGRVRLLQPEKGFHASLDTVFLAAAAEIRARQRVLDVGCGVGSAGLCLFARQPDLHLTGLDIQPELVDLALQNGVLNGVENRCRFFHGDLKTEKHTEDNFFDVILMNPPYQRGGTASPDKIKSIAHGEAAGGANLIDWIKYAHKKLKNGGNLALVHRADRLDEIAVALTHKKWFGSLEILPLHPYEGEEAKRVIIRARKEKYAPLKLKSGFVIHKKGGAYTDAAEGVLSRAEPLF